MERICKESGTSAEIIFPVNDAAVTADDASQFGLVPGVSGGEGCSTAGGCASCPFMKMNDLDKLMDLVGKVKEDGSVPTSLQRQIAKSRGDIKVGEHSVAELGGQPISYMNHLTTNRSFPEELKRLVARE